MCRAPAGHAALPGSGGAAEVAKRPRAARQRAPVRAVRQPASPLRHRPLSARRQPPSSPRSPSFVPEAPSCVASSPSSPRPKRSGEPGSNFPSATPCRSLMPIDPGSSPGRHCGCGKRLASIQHQNPRRAMPARLCFWSHPAREDGAGSRQAGPYI
jgi:hypothetical protein